MVKHIVFLLKFTLSAIQKRTRETNLRITVCCLHTVYSIVNKKTGKYLVLGEIKRICVLFFISMIQVEFMKRKQEHKCTISSSLNRKH